jgi:hypothetical protein
MITSQISLRHKGHVSVPPAKAVAKLLQAGLIGVVVDGLSEIQRPNAQDEIVSALKSGKIYHLIVTSRTRCPEPEVMRDVTLAISMVSNLRVL